MSSKRAKSSEFLVIMHIVYSLKYISIWSFFCEFITLCIKCSVLLLFSVFFYIKMTKIHFFTNKLIDFRFKARYTMFVMCPLSGNGS